MRLSRLSCGGKRFIFILKAPSVKITFQFEAQLRQAAGRSELSMELKPGCSASQALQILAEQISEDFAVRVLSGAGQVQSGLLVFLNERPLLPAELAAATLHEGDVVLLYPPISGG
jgi:molybdopterin converting factor small subunit